MMTAVQLRIRRLLTVGLLLIGVSAVFLSYWEYSKEEHASPHDVEEIVAGHAVAPIQYRIALPLTAYAMGKVTHLGSRHVYAAVDAVALAVTMLLLRRRLLGAAWFAGAAAGGQLVAVLTMLLLLAHYLAWLEWYHRPETLPSAAVLVLSAALVEGLRARWRWAAVLGLVMLSGVQDLMRCDVALALGCGLIIAALLNARHEQRGTTVVALVTGALIVGVSIGAQYVLARVVYPHANYGTTEVLQAWLNLRDVVRWVPFVCFCVPALWTLKVAWGMRGRLGLQSTAVAASTAVYLLLWYTFGILQEVRIFMPFAVMMIPLTLEAVRERVLGAGVEAV